MNRNRFALLSIALTLALGLAACGGKKAPAGPAAAGGAGTESGVTEGAGTEGGAAGAGLGESAGSLPVVHFDYDQSAIRADAKEPLKKAAEIIGVNGSSQVTIEGHCDERGSSEYNLALGERRAQSVKSYLRTLGIDGKRLSTISYGKERPVDPGHGEEAWAKNRRADLIVNR